MGMKDLRDKHPGIAKKIAPTKVEKAAQARREAGKGRKRDATGRFGKKGG